MNPTTPSDAVSVHERTCKLQPGLRSETRAVIDRTQLGANAAATHIIPPLPPPPLAAGLFSTDKYFTDSSRRYPPAVPPLLRGNAPPRSLPPPFLSRLSVLFYKRRGDTVSQRHTFPPPCPSRLSGWICRDGGHTWRREVDTHIPYKHARTHK